MLLSLQIRKLSAAGLRTDPKSVPKNVRDGWYLVLSVEMESECKCSL